MRTKVEKKQKKELDEKLKMNMQSAKVVLDANDCARLLEGAGKTSVIVVEKEGKMVAASSMASSSRLCSSSPVNCLGPSIKPVSSEPSPVDTVPIFATKSHSTFCSDNSGSTRDPVEIEQNLAVKKGVAEDSTASARKGVLDESKKILKPPKKRRAIEVEIESETLPPSVVKNGDVIHPPLIPSANQLTESSCSNAGSSQKHSVERLLQHDPAPSLKPHISTITNNNNNNTNFSTSYRELPQSQSILSAGMELTTSTVQTSVPSLMSSSKQQESQSPPCHPVPLQSKCNLYVQPSQEYNDNAANRIVQEEKLIRSTKSIGDSSLRTSSSALSERGCKKSIHLSPEQEEPINLSTSSKPVISPVTSQICTKTPAEGCEPVVSAHSATSALPERYIGEDQGTNINEFGLENKPQLLPKAPDSNSLHSSKLNHLQHNGLSADVLTLRKGNDENCPSKDLALSHSPQPSHTSPQVLDSKNHPHTHAVLTPENIEASSHSLHHDPLCSPTPKTEKVLDQYLSADAGSCKLLNDPEPSEPKSKTDDNSQLKRTEAVSKIKKPPKKRVEILMDEASCTHRLAQYALTIDDVIENYVYVPEPVEEIRLTEEEELALRDQFGSEDPGNRDKVADSAKSTSDEVTHSDLSASVNATSTAEPAASTSESGKSQISPASHPKKQPSLPEPHTEAISHNTVQASSNIDSVLAFVAADVTEPVANNDHIISAESTMKRKKIAKVPIPKEVNAGDPPPMEKKKKKKKVKGWHQQVSENIPVSSQPPKNSPPGKSNSSADNHAETKSPKQKKAKKRKSSDNFSSSDQSIHSKESSTTEQPKGISSKKKKKVGTAQKRLKEVSSHCQSTSASLSHTPAELTTALLGVSKDILASNKTTETSDIGESIASTSGGSEQDTPIHESELLTSKTSKGAMDKDKDSQDTGLESSGGEDSLNKPIRRYKKRLDFVKCEQCEHQARGRSALSRHMKKVHQVEVDMPHRCPHCSYGCSKQASLNRHLFTHGVYSCSRCSFVGETRQGLSQHVMESHRDKLDLKLCKVCNRYIKCDQVTIEEHTSACQGPTPYKCTVCDKEFKYGSSLRVHYHTHFPDQPKKFKCDLCDYRTNYKANLHKHHKNMHAVKGKEIQCPDCGKPFATEDNMRRHRKVHTLARPFACETCKKTFKTSGALKGHQLIHTATRPYTCNITGCNRSFRTPKFLKSHQEEFHRLVPKKFFCSVEGCNYSFFKRSHLKRHAITHTGERNFHCTWPGCNKSFRHSDNLKVHFRSHTVEKTLLCHLCDFKTKQKNSMFWHKKKVHQIVETSKTAEAASSSSRGSDSKTEEKATSGEVQPPASHAPAVAESGCQTALVLSEQSEDGSLMDGLQRAHGVEKPADAGKKQDQSCLDAKAASRNEEVVGSQLTPSASDQGPKDLYEFKSDDDSEEETPGTFRRDLIPKDELTPLPPPPKELLMKNEMEEQKEQARKEREQKKELEKKEKAEKREQEKKEKAEKKEFEKKEKIEKKEIEKKEKIEKKELEKKKKIEKKEMEKKEKIEKKELEKKEKIEKRECEKKEKAEKKEQEKRDKIEKKELELKEKAEKREKERIEKEQAWLEKEKVKKEREEQRKAKEQLRLEKEKERELKRIEKERLEKEKSEEKHDKEQKRETEKKRDKEEKNNDTDTKKLKPFKKKAQAKSKEDNAKNSGTPTKAVLGKSKNVYKKSPMRVKSISKRLPARGERKKSHIVVRKRSPRRFSPRQESEVVEEKPEAKTEKPKRGRKKKVVQETQVEKEVPVVGIRKKRGDKELELESPPIKKKRGRKSSSEATVMSPRSPRSPRGTSPRSATLKASVTTRKALASPAKKVGVPSAKKKPGPVPRKMSARIKARTLPVTPNNTKVLVKGRRGAKPGPKKKSLPKKEEEVKEKGVEENVKEVAVPKEPLEKVTESKSTSRKEASQKQVGVKKISTRSRMAKVVSEEANGKKANPLDESVALPTRPESPAYSEELMLQGNASPYRDFSDADNTDKDEEKEEKDEEKSLDDRLSSPAFNSEAATQDETDEDKEAAGRKTEEEDIDEEKSNQASASPEETEPVVKGEDTDAGHSEDAYSSDDDDVSNDIPLTPPRAPAPPPVESSEDEMEDPADPESSAPFSVPGPNTPFSVPGPNTPFSVPGPHTPFSVPPPTNMMQQQHSVPPEDTPLSTVPSVPSTELHSQGSVELQHSMGSVELHHSQGSVELHHSQGSVELHHSQGSVELHHSQGSVEMHHSQNSVEMPQPQGSVEMHQPQGSVEMHQSSMEMHSHNSSVEMKSHGSVDMHVNNSSGELHTQGSGEVHPHRTSETNHTQGNAHMHSDGTPMDMDIHSQRPVDIYSHNSVDMRQQDSFDSQSEASTIQKLRDEAMNSVKSSEGIIMREGSDTSSMSDKYHLPHHLVESLGKYSFPHPFPEQSHSEADKAYFDQYLKSLSSSRGGLSSGLGSSPTGLQQLEAMVGKSHVDGAPKSPVNSLPSSMIPSFDSTLPGDSRTRMDTLVPPDARSQHHDTLYSGRETPSSLSRLSERQNTTTPLPPTSAPTPAFEAFSHLNPLHAPPPGTPVPGRDSAYLRQTENLFPTPPVSSSFMAEAMFQRQAMSTPFLPPPPPQAGERSSVLTPHISDSRCSSSSSLLRRPGTMPASDMFSASQAMQQTMPRNPFTNAWASQDSRPSHWQTPYLPRQSNMATPGTFFPGKESYLTGRDFMFDPSVRASADGRSMFPSLSGTPQSQESLPLDRFDLSNYFPNAAAMTPYGSSAAATSLDYTRTAHTASSKPFDERYRQASVGAGATSGTIPDFRSLPAVSGSGPEMFPGIPGVNPGFNLYAAAGNPMSYHHHRTQHPHHHQLTDGSVNSAFLSHHHHHHHHPGSAQHAAMFERDYRGFYPQNAAAAAAAAYPFINDRQYAGSASKLGHSHPSVGPCPTASSADRNLMARAAAPEGQMQDPYRAMLYRY